MRETENDTLRCRCGAIGLMTTGRPVVRAYCHCRSCRDLYGGPMVAATSWRSDDVCVVRGKLSLRCFSHPVVQMQRHFCSNCGEVLFGTNRLGFKTIPNALAAANNAGQLPVLFQPALHLFYAFRQIDVDDELPKYLERTGGPLFVPQPRTPARVADSLALP